jgi:hypothetical protein
MLEGLKPASHDKKCLVGRTLESLEKPDAIILQDALDDEDRWSSHALETALGGRGIKLGNGTIRKHRDKVCLCFRI